MIVEGAALNAEKIENEASSTVFTQIKTAFQES
ncbi:hypothetical protein C7374_11637 [Falsochrobactrum ovis]|uniref:Uncharacterized protein n=1 Tax=Falsochrobactrum ovis TaxID=1293442 RepID=A0A364JSI5_9HYPH|nr:hypothetical protein C7374_11637 [Falsochrobactrum ovis]